MTKDELLKELERVLNNTSTYEPKVQAEVLFQYLVEKNILKDLKDET